jgi:hypothetical protein
MTKGTLLAVVVGCSALAGCGTLPPGPIGMAKKPLDCRSTSDCKVAVRIDCLEKLFHCIPTVADEVVIVSVKNKKEKITFGLPKDSSYKFDKRLGGIVFDDASAWGCATDDAEVTCTGKKEEFGVYKYTINVVGLFAVPNDPWVVNN